MEYDDEYTSDEDEYFEEQDNWERLQDLPYIFSGMLNAIKWNIDQRLMDNILEARDPANYIMISDSPYPDNVFNITE